MVRFTIAAIILFAAGCATQPTLDTSAAAQRSFDGLYPIQNTVVDEAWARADLNLGGYTRIKPEGAGIQFRPARPVTRTLTRTRDRSEFPISQANRERLGKTLTEAFT